MIDFDGTLDKDRNYVNVGDWVHVLIDYSGMFDLPVQEYVAKIASIDKESTITIIILDDGTRVNPIFATHITEEEAMLLRMKL